MRFYPPLFFQRIWVKRFHPGFRGIDVVIYKSIFNRNYNASIFGGTIYAAVDPFYPILFDQILKNKGFKTLVWLKSGSVKYIKPARSNLNFTIQLSDDEIKEAEEMILSTGKFVGSYHITLYNQQQEACAWMESEVYVRDLNFSSENKKLRLWTIIEVSLRLMAFKAKRKL